VSVAPIDSAVDVGRALGLVVERPVVLKNSLNLVVRLAPTPVVARVAARTAVLRGTEPLADAVALAAWLAEAGLPVARPTALVDPGPHVGPGGWAMTLWELQHVVDRPADPIFTGRSLRAIHEAAAGYPGSLRHVGPLAEIERLLVVAEDAKPADVDRLRAYAARVELPSLPAQPVHGDAHLGNVMVTTRGAVWGDWEESWRGPVAWDLAALDHRRRVHGELTGEIGAALRAYGAYDRGAVEAWGDVVTLWAAAWGIVFARELPRLGEGTNRRLAWLAERFGF
jgi:aminoglycoside phosphotransferase (APT) family kinase protein